MARDKRLQATLMATADATEQRFYEAMQQGDVERLMSCWAEDDEVSAASVDGMRVHGLAAVRRHFDAVLGQGGFDVRPVHVRRMLLGGCAIHHVLEQVRLLSGGKPETAYVISSNVYINTPQGWRLVMHHASPGQATELEGGTDSQLGALLH
jgi:ketosteroid isomerase-like protein